jgi:hypothetical protein
MQAKGGKGAVGRTLKARIIDGEQLNQGDAHFRAESAEFRQIGEFPDTNTLFGSQGTNGNYCSYQAAIGSGFLISHNSPPN